MAVPTKMNITNPWFICLSTKRVKGPSRKVIVVSNGCIVRFSISTPMYLRNEPQIGLERPQVRGIYKFILTRLAALQINC